ncbi:MAG: cysteine desulfurase [Patescibacteria group bacterium]|nr:cysteine desulfurase [Patescibacteria group bacterium]
MFDVNKIREDFPILKRKINGHDLVYLDNAATSQKPKAVIEAVADFYENHNANVHRGVHTLSEEATQMYEEARVRVAKFINARLPSEIIFVRNSTEALNLIVWSRGKAHLKKGDEILLSEMEHHSNLVPWQLLAKEVGAVLKFISFDENGELEISNLKSQFSNRTKVVSVVHVSNSLGTINPIKEMTKLAHEVGAIVVVDAAQSVPHMKVDVQSLGCDFLAFSGHKMLGPMGIGVLYGRQELLEVMPPFLSGGDMIRSVTINDATWNEVPYKFEAGTPNVAGAVGLSAAIGYLANLGMDNVRQHEIKLTDYALKKLSVIPGLKVLGPLDAQKRGGVIAFTLKGTHPHDLASVLDGEGIAVRSGHHCTMPVHLRLGIPASTRASFYIYNTKEEVDKLVDGLEKAKRLLTK